MRSGNPSAALREIVSGDEEIEKVLRKLLDRIAEGGTQVERTFDLKSQIYNTLDNISERAQKSGLREQE